MATPAPLPIPRRPVVLLAALLLAVGTLIGPGPTGVDRVRAESCGLSRWPLFGQIAPSAPRILMGRVVAILGRGDPSGRGAFDDRTVSSFRFQVEEQVRGRGPSAVTFAGVQTDSWCAARGLRIRVGDRLGIATRLPTVGDPSPIGAVVTIGRDPRDPRDGTQRATADHVRQWATLRRPDLLFYSAYRVRADGTRDPRRSLWQSDGRRSGTRRVAHADGTGPWDPRDLVAIEGHLLFTADDGIHGREPWVSDGTIAGTRMLRDIRPGPLGSDPQDMWGRGGAGLFSADDGVHGREPWIVSDRGGSIRMLGDIRPGPDGSDPTDLRYRNGGVWFSADDGTHGREPWTTDDDRVVTGKGPWLVADLRPGPLGSDPREFVLWSTTVLMTADDGASGREVWAAYGPTRLTDIDATGPSDPHGLTVVPDGDGWSSRWLFLWASDGSGAARPYALQVRSLDDTPDRIPPPVLLSEDAREPAGPHGAPVAIIGPRVVFPATEDGGRGQLWVTGGSPSDTIRLTDDPQGIDVRAITALDDRALLVRSFSGGSVTMVTDATTRGTTHPYASWPNPRRPADPVRFGDAVVFRASMSVPRPGFEDGPEVLWIAEVDADHAGRPIPDTSRPTGKGVDPGEAVWVPPVPPPTS
ncbi:MAG: hypothetical protein KF809_07530 [Chloroflexi bacterium]|nr:hypothetical protein [Chloroflexota bacterium]